MKQQYYEIRKTIKKFPDARYLVIFGERSNGKSYSALSYAVEMFYVSGFTKAFGYLRRWTDDVKQSNMQQVFKSLMCNDKGENEIEKVTGGKYNHVTYKSRKFYLDHIDSEGNIDDSVDTPLGYVFSLSESERIKSTGYPSIKFIIFDEFISEGLPMISEFTRFNSVLSTIIRNRDDVLIALLGNTINKYNDYFDEFRMDRARTQERGTVDVYTYQDDDGRNLVLVSEYADFPDRKVKKSNIYFAYNKENNQMIRTGAWSIGSYPHLTHFYKPKDIKEMYFISYKNQLFQCEIIKVRDIKENLIFQENSKVTGKNIVFTFIHPKTTDIKDFDKHILYQIDPSPHPNVRNNIAKPYDDISRFIWSFFTAKKVMYLNNSVGDAVFRFIEAVRYT